jgi:electron-transferring-flavoprotein dehydrogenase
MNPIDVLIIGAGPAGLATAIRLKQTFNRERKNVSVMVIDKAPSLGAHSLSGAVFEPECLDELLPGWRDGGGSVLSEMAVVEKDEMWFLTAKSAFRIPSLLVPRGMHHKGDQLVSLGRLVDWLGQVATKEGVEIYTGLSAASLIWEGDSVRGVKLVDQGLDKERKPKSNYQEGETVLAKVTVLADGCRGVLSREYASRLGGQENPQVYSVGIKQIFRLPKGNHFGPNRAVHTLGFPNRPDVFGGGFFYSLGEDLLAAGLILGLDWRYTDLNPQLEMEYWKTHPFVADLLKGAEVIAAGAKTIPEGGFYSLPKLWTAGALVVGDAAGFVDMEKIKGIHYAILSGMAAADAVSATISGGGSLAMYPVNLEERGVMAEMRHARNFRQAFQWGLYAGAPLSQIQTFLPFRIGIKPDHTRTRSGAALKRDFKPALERATFAYLSNTMQREDEPSHLVIPDAELCRKCEKEFGSPCTIFCPTEVYGLARLPSKEKGEANYPEQATNASEERGEGSSCDPIHISATNCLHCGTCAIKCPLQNIIWTPPEGGEGPRYKKM